MADEKPSPSPAQAPANAPKTIETGKEALKDTKEEIENKVNNEVKEVLQELGRVEFVGMNPEKAEQIYKGFLSKDLKAFEGVMEWLSTYELAKRYGVKPIKSRELLILIIDRSPEMLVKIDPSFVPWGLCGGRYGKYLEEIAGASEKGADSAFMFAEHLKNQPYAKSLLIKAAKKAPDAAVHSFRDYRDMSWAPDILNAAFDKDNDPQLLGYALNTFLRNFEQYKKWLNPEIANKLYKKAAALRPKSQGEPKE